ncbi:MAG: hypothetical protein KDK28_01310 [Maritimibacter sp.]|nr:hypothetical protein [Maritimibacter sp.]
MLTRYLRRLYHDRRRIAFSAALTLAAGYFGRDVLPDPLPVPTEALVVAGFLASIPLFTARFRAKRHWVELIALGNLIVTFAGDVWPEGFFGWHDVAFMLTLQIPAYMGIVTGLNALIYGKWSEVYGPRRRFMVRTTLRSRLPLHDLWYGMVPTPGFLEHNPDREVVSIEFADASRKNVRLTTWMPPRAGTGEALITFDRIEPLRYVRFKLTVLRGTRDPDGEGETEFLFEDRGSHRVMYLRHRVNGCSLRRAILGYFDDTYGRMMAARLDAIESRARDGRITKTRTDVSAWFETQAEFKEVRGDEGGGYRTAYGRRRTDDETRVLRALDRI